MFKTPSAFVAPAQRAGERFTGERHLLQNYARAPVEIVRGEGCYLIDRDGTRYLDMVAGIAVCALGHAHPAITEAVAAQAATLVQASNLFHHEPSGSLANELSRRSGFERVFFCNSGTEANEAAIKLARKRAWRLGERERTTILSCEGGFHGRTFGALAATSNVHYREGFEPLPGGFAHVPFDDVSALEAIDEHTAAFIVEPVQGESGVRPASKEYLSAAREACNRSGAMLIFDEIQCGMGRLGTTFAFATFGVRPDLVTLAKSLANGLPIGAVLVDGTAAEALQPGDHGTTFGGSPVPCAAALAHLRVRDELDLDAHVGRAGVRLHAGLTSLAERYPALLAQPRGIGLMLGLPVRPPFAAKAIVDHAREREHLLLNAAGDNTLRFVPPLTISHNEVDAALAGLDRTLERVSRDKPTA